MSNALNNNSVVVTVNLPHLFLVQIIWIDGQQQSQIILDCQMLIYGDRFELGEGLLLPFKHFLNDVHIQCFCSCTTCGTVNFTVCRCQRKKTTTMWDQTIYSGTG